VPRKSAGLLLYRRTSGGPGGPARIEVLLAHPGGPYWARKDDGAWSIPKGEFLDDEEPLAAARREFEEEMGHPADGDFLALEPIKQPSGKLVLAWAVCCDFDPSTLESHMFSMEWPPKSGLQAQFPEVDRAAWFSIDIAKRKILKGQAPFLDQLLAKVPDRTLDARPAEARRTPAPQRLQRSLFDEEPLP
jgi:predicted NUDIX family NTP pyrophosphohydrolase